MSKEYRILAVFCFLILFVVGTASAVTIYVPDDYAKIQWAVDNATTGDTIIIRNGTYNEHVVIDKNVILIGENKPIVDGGGTGTVIHVLADNVVIKNIKVQNSGYGTGDCGIRVRANNVMISNCEVRDSRVAVAFGGDNNFLNSSIIQNGSVVISGSYNIVESNDFSKSKGAAVILDSYYKETFSNLISNNTIHESISGIDLYNRAHDNTITRNSITSTIYGVYISSGFGPPGYSNYIYLNNFNTERGAYSEGINFWHSPQPITYTHHGQTFTNYLGNYWVNYTGSDADGDGIGDVAYIIDSNNTDYYPLTEKFENYIIGFHNASSQGHCQNNIKK